MNVIISASFDLDTSSHCMLACFSTLNGSRKVLSPALPLAANIQHETRKGQVKSSYGYVYWCFE
jgi:hypothetical protein